MMGHYDQDYEHEARLSAMDKIKREQEKYKLKEVAILDSDFDEDHKEILLVILKAQKKGLI
jgi:hypothetical protein